MADLTHFDSLKKSNFLISAKYKATVMELRTTYAALEKIQEGDYVYEGLQPKVVMTGAEIARRTGAKSHNIYKQLVPVANSMTGRNIGYVDDDKQEFSFMSFITNADFKDGKLVILFNKDSDKYIRNQIGSFTLQDHDIMMSFSTAYAFRLYEHLKKKCYYPPYYKGVKDGRFVFIKNLAEFKFDIGAADPEKTSIKQKLKTGSTDYEAILEKISDEDKTQSYDTWANFKARCLNPAVKEINEKSDISVSYEPIKASRGKIRELEFTVILKDFVNPDNNTEEVTEEMKFSFAMNAGEKLRGYGITNPKDIMAIGEASSYDLGKLYNALEVYDTLAQAPKNTVGWLIDAIREEYQKPNVSTVAPGEYDAEALWENFYK